LGAFIYTADTNYHDLNLAGPTIGNTDPGNTTGGAYAPYMIERFTQVAGSTLTIYYTMSTWNPYTVVLMESRFSITHPPAGGTNWVATWGTSPQPPALAGPNYAGSTNQTVRMIIHTSIGGTQARVRLSNTFGTNALVIGAAHIALAGTNAAIVPGTDTALTFNGAGSVTIPPGALALSDGVTFNAPALTNLAISLYISTASGPLTLHAVALQTNYVSPRGNFTSALTMPVAYTVTASYYLVNVEVRTAANILAIITLGDSITDGFHSTANANHRWPNDLARQLALAHTNLAVVDEGISGNRLLQDGVGPSGLSRFDRDVLSQAGAGYAIVLLGVNDIGHSTTNQPVTSDQLIGGYEQLVARAHAQGLKIFGCTITPFGGSGYDSPEHETLRESVNDFLRANNPYDGLIDFDAAVRDPSHPQQLQTNYDSGDHLHPNDAGYQAMAAAIDPTRLVGGSAFSFRPGFITTPASDQAMGLSWTATPGGFVLEETGALIPPVDWQFSTLTPGLSNGVFSLSVPVTTSTRFFRIVTAP
jgi:lysophospholipase L1-like esterase